LSPEPVRNAMEQTSVFTQLLISPTTELPKLT
jgi:hypothetical protein